MNRLFSFFSLGLLCFMVGCNVSDPEPEVVGTDTIDFVVTASTGAFEEADVETKVTSQYVVKFAWEAGDRISVVNLRTRKMLGGSLRAASSGNTTDFSGILKGTMVAGDPLLFIYPAKGNLDETDFSEVQYDFSQQDGSSSNGVFLQSYAVGQASGKSGQTTISSTDLAFYYLICYNYASLSNLPKATDIDSVRISGVPNMLGLSWDYSSNSIVTRSIYTKDGVETDDYNESSILLRSSSLRTGNNGDRPVYFTCPGISTSISSDKVIRVSIGNAAYEGTLPSTGRYGAGYNYRRVLSNFHRVDGIDLSFSAPFTYDFDGDENMVDDPEGIKLERGWRRGDELSVVNLTTGELLTGTLSSSDNGGITDFSGSVFGEKGINDGDRLLFLYPSVGNESTMDFRQSPIIYDVLGEQNGTLGDLPMIMAAKATYSNGEVALDKWAYFDGEERNYYSFEHLTSVIKLTADLTFDYCDVDLGGDEEVGDEEDAEISGTDGDDGGSEEEDNEGFEEEGGDWGDGEGGEEEDFPVLNFTPSMMEVRHVPTKLIISYDEDEDFCLATIAGSEVISVSNECGVVVEDNKASAFYVMVPAASKDAEGVYTSISAAYQDPDGPNYISVDFQWHLRVQRFYEIHIPLPDEWLEDY